MEYNIDIWRNTATRERRPETQEALQLLKKIG